jgi:hypothetical protein
MLAVLANRYHDADVASGVLSQPAEHLKKSVSYFGLRLAYALKLVEHKQHASAYATGAAEKCNTTRKAFFL